MSDAPSAPPGREPEPEDRRRSDPKGSAEGGPERSAAEPGGPTAEREQSEAEPERSTAEPESEGRAQEAEAEGRPHEPEAEGRTQEAESEGKPHDPEPEALRQAAVPAGSAGSPHPAEPPPPGQVTGPGHASSSPWPQHAPQYAHHHAPQYAPPPWRGPAPPSESWLDGIRPEPPAPVRMATLWSTIAAALLSALLLGDGLGVNLLIVAVPAALAAFFAARAADRRLRPWTAVWAIGALALLLVPALSDASWPTFLAVVAALAAGSLALHGGRTWPGVVFGSVGILDSLVTGPAWGWRGLRERADGSRGRWGPVVRTVAVAAGLLVVFGALFAGADAAFADLLGELIPDVSLVDGPWRFFLFLLALAGTLAAARTAAAPLRWDRLARGSGKARGRVEWALPLIVLNLLFAAFIAVQLAVLFGGYDKVLSETGLSYAEYARQGFWQLLWATLLTLIVIGLALRWAPRDGARDRSLVRAVLGTLCVLTLVVVASALRRMDLYVDAYGLTRLRISVAAMELWLGLVIVLIIAAGLLGSRWLPRAVAGSAAAAVLVFGLASPDALIAERNVQRYERTGKIDVDYLRDLSADAVPALDRLREPLRSCVLRTVQDDFAMTDSPWYATSWAEVRARSILEERPADTDRAGCPRSELYGDERDEYDGDAEFDIPVGPDGTDDTDGYDPGTGMD
ncbi:DUF4153 domain-containing protein [Streptomyces sp. FIT100]|uniref:DUF4153 domain-containing protein n=1 Tax=Streptomyces sp. FIT100 TaxID=2837956 RepID=UPI0037DA5BB4